MKLMLDTNIFNLVCDGEIDPKAFKAHQLISTHVQFDELNRTKCTSRRDDLRQHFEIIAPATVPTENFVLDISQWDWIKWPDEDSNYQSMLDRLRELDKKSKKKCKLDNQRRDILIAETAVKSNCVLVSDDGNLRAVTEEFGGSAWSPSDLKTK